MRDGLKKHYQDYAADNQIQQIQKLAEMDWKDEEDEEGNTKKKVIHFEGWDRTNSWHDLSLDWINCNFKTQHPKFFLN